MTFSDRPIREDAFHIKVPITGKFFEPKRKILVKKEM